MRRIAEAAGKRDVGDGAVREARIVQVAPCRSAYAYAYDGSECRAAQPPIWLHRYNWHRPHGSLKAKTPISRLGLPGDNLLRLHS